MSAYSITLTGAFAYITIAILSIIALMGLSILLLGAYKLFDFTLRQTLTYFEINVLFFQFIREKKYKRPPGNRMSEEEAEAMHEKLARK